jgi:hypothetical protein
MDSINHVPVGPVSKHALRVALVNILLGVTVSVRGVIGVPVPKICDPIQVIHACRVLLVHTRMAWESLAVHVPWVPLLTESDQMGAKYARMVGQPLQWVARLARDALPVHIPI